MYTILHAAIGYFFLLLTVRILVRRPGGQITPFEVVIIFLIGGVIILATVGDDRSMTNCICAVITVGLIHRVLALARPRFPRFSAWIDGIPMVLLRDSQWQSEAMEGLRLDPSDIMAAGRDQGLTSLSEIKFAVVERNGSISIIKKQENSGAKEKSA